MGVQYLNAANITDPPSVAEEESFITALQHDEAKLPCEVYGAPKPQVKWLKNNQELSGEKYKIDSDNTLRLIMCFIITKFIFELSNNTYNIY